jgi:hypothetical protein
MFSKGSRRKELLTVSPIKPTEAIKFSGGLRTVLRLLNNFRVTARNNNNKVIV